ncbi:histone-lysine N-methyltransferase SETMAR [Trichonephila clavipes]|nr:histone-lysine N-methyltransferase SETMAR [Trichonephila clavipes]
MVVILEHVMRYYEDGNDFLFRIVTMDESWFHHSSPEGHTKGVEKSAITCLKEFNTTSYAGKVFLTVFLDPQGVVLLNVLEVGTIDASDTMTPCRNRKRQFSKSDLGFSDLAFCCWMTMRDYNRLRQCKAILQLLVGSTLHHSPNSSDLASSDFTLFPALKKNFAGSFCFLLLNVLIQMILKSVIKLIFLTIGQCFSNCGEPPRRVP